MIKPQRSSNASFSARTRTGIYLRSRAELTAAQELEAQTLLLQSQLEYPQAQDELTEAIGQTAR